MTRITGGWKFHKNMGLSVDPGNFYTIDVSVSMSAFFVIGGERQRAAMSMYSDRRIFEHLEYKVGPAEFQRFTYASRDPLLTRTDSFPREQHVFCK